MADDVENWFCASIEWLEEYENVGACERFIAVAREQTEIEMNTELSMPVAFTNVQDVNAALFKNAELLEMEVSVAVNACIIYERLYRRILGKEANLNKETEFVTVELTYDLADVFISLFLSVKCLQDFQRVRFNTLCAVIESHYELNIDTVSLQKREAEVLNILSYQVRFQHPQEISISLYMKLRKKYPELSFNLNEEYSNQLHIAIDLFYNFFDGVHYIMKCIYQKDNKSLWLRYLMFDPLHVGMTLTLFVVEKTITGGNVDSTEAVFEDLESWSSVKRYFCSCIVAYLGLVLDNGVTPEAINYIIQNYTRPE